MCLGTPGRILEFTDTDRRSAVVDFAGTPREVNTAMVAGDADPPDVGDWVMVHMGIALHRMTPQEATGTAGFFEDLLAEFEDAAARRDAEARPSDPARGDPH